MIPASRGWWLAAASVLLAACNPSTGGGGDPPSGALVVSSDPMLQEMAAALVPALAEGAGLPLRSPVRVEAQTRQELVAHVEDRLDRDLPEGEARLVVDAYAMLGLAPPELDLRALLMEVYREQVAGFYDPGAGTLYVLDDQPGSALEPLLLHELVHAIQDQHVSLDSLTAVGLGNDRRLAARAAIEGHATLVMLAWMTGRQEGRTVRPEDLPELGATLRPDAATMSVQYPALASAPRVFRETLLFPYVEGAAFVQALWRGTPGRPAPFGEHLPRSTEQVLHPGRSLGGEGDPPVEVRVEAPEGFTVLMENTLGALETRIFEEELSGRRLHDEGPLGWGGDRWLLVERADGARGLLWVTVWDSPAARERFLLAVAPHLDMIGLPTRLEGGRVDGREAAILRVGAVVAVQNVGVGR